VQTEAWWCQGRLHEDHGSGSCHDWSERTPHLAGRLGAAVAELFITERWVLRARESRALRLTDRGAAALAAELGLRL